MTSADPRFLSETQRTWPRAFLTAALIEGSMAALFLIALFARPPIFIGADNPLVFYLAGLLHLPSSLLFPVLDSAAIQAAPGSGLQSMLFPCVIVALLQFLLIAILLRRPWRRRHRGSVV